MKNFVSINLSLGFIEIVKYFEKKATKTGATPKMKDSEGEIDL